MSAFIITRIQVGDYDSWRAMFARRSREGRDAANLPRGTSDPHQRARTAAVDVDYCQCGQGRAPHGAAQKTLGEAGA